MKYLALSTSYPRRFTLIKAIGYIISISAMLYSANSPAPPSACTSTGTGNWNAIGTWDCSTVPTATSDVIIASPHVVTVDVNAAAQTLTVDSGGTLNFSSSFTLDVGASGIQNSGIITIGSGGITTGDFTPTDGSMTLNGNLTISGDIYAGATTVSGTGKMILTDADHTINGAVNVRNLETAAFTGAHTITINGTVTATGTTKLNGSATGAITLTGGTFTPATTAYYCAASTTTNVTCNVSAPPISASLNLMSNQGKRI